jgi:dTDP-4-amino-4,6-dideoxygalactose transaminase
MSSKRLKFSAPDIGISEKIAVLKVLNSGVLTQGDEVKKFERNFSKLVDSRESISVNSGTSSLLLALLSLNIGRGDEVIVPAFTFAATANAVVLAGAVPVFADIDNRTFNISVEDVKKKITQNTRAIIVVHLFGLTAEMTSFTELCKEKNLLLIEDAAQAHLANAEGKVAGTFGDAACFSFYPSKNMTTGEGGMVVFKDSEPARIARLLRNQGMESRYKNEVVGFNFRMSEIAATLGISQIRKLPKLTEARRINAQFYDEKLPADIIPYVPPNYYHVYHQYTLTIQHSRDQLKEELEKVGIPSMIYYPIPVNQLPSFKSPKNCPNAEGACSTVLSIPIFPGLSKRNRERIARFVSDLFECLSINA